MLKILKSEIWTLFAILLLNAGCSTVVPKPIMDTEASYDSTTPSQYDKKNSGIIGFITGSKDETVGAIVTKGFQQKYFNLLHDYGLQLYDAEKIHVRDNDGLENYKDIYGNDLFIIDSQHLAYFLKMNRWKKEGRPVDSIWLKIKNQL